MNPNNPEFQAMNQLFVQNLVSQLSEMIAMNCLHKAKITYLEAQLAEAQGVDRDRAPRLPPEQ